MSTQAHISASAFLVNESRARNVALSGDKYAKLWVNEETRRLWEDFSREVYPHDAVELGCRNRFFLERMRAQLGDNGLGALVNIAAGFTSYPFLIDSPVPCFEVDLAPVVAIKCQAISRWQREGVLPVRNIEFICADLSDATDQTAMQQRLADRLDGLTSFFLMEGLTYYLEPEMFSRLLTRCAELQPPGSILAFDFWTPDVLDHPVFQRFREFCASRFGHDREQYNLLALDDMAAVDGYELVELTDIQQLEVEFAGTRVLANFQEILPENYVVLRRV
ncbi:MAG: class I SAM-dependent methyltransferase [bacterium]